jgi:hypothetical protein
MVKAPKSKRPSDIIYGSMNQPIYVTFPMLCAGHLIQAWGDEKLSPLTYTKRPEKQSSRSCTHQILQYLFHFHDFGLS